jgi:hypothetical protein
MSCETGNYWSALFMIIYKELMETVKLYKDDEGKREQIRQLSYIIEGCDPQRWRERNPTRDEFIALLNAIWAEKQRICDIDLTLWEHLANAIIVICSVTGAYDFFASHVHFESNLFISSLTKKKEEEHEKDEKQQPIEKFLQRESAGPAVAAAAGMKTPRTVKKTEKIPQEPKRPRLFAPLTISDDEDDFEDDTHFDQDEEVPTPKDDDDDDVVDEIMTQPNVCEDPLHPFWKKRH